MIIFFALFCSLNKLHFTIAQTILHITLHFDYNMARLIHSLCSCQGLSRIRWMFQRTWMLDIMSCPSAGIVWKVLKYGMHVQILRSCNNLA